jgi:choline dehydrogenase
MLGPAYAAKAEAEFNITPGRGPYTLVLSNTALYISLPNIMTDYMDIVNKMRSMVNDGSSAAYLPSDADPTLIAGYKRQLSVLTDFFKNPEAPSVELPFATGTTIRPIILHPLSRGSVFLNSTDHLAQPLLDYCTGSKSVDFDFDIAHVRWLRKVTDTPTMQKYGAVPFIPDPSIQSDKNFFLFFLEEISCITLSISSMNTKMVMQLKGYRALRMPC